jgi:hypothetical protein
MRRLTLLAGVVLLAGCSNMLNPEGKTASPSPSPLPSGVASLVDTGDETLAPGRYARYDFEPRITFDLDGNWSGRQFIDGYFTIQQGDADSADVVAIQFGRPSAIFGEDGEREPTNAADAVAILQTNPDLEIVETDTSEVGGLAGSQITIENPAQVPDAGSGGPATICELCVDIMRLPPGVIAINPDRRLWIAFFDTNQGLLSIMVGGATDQWDEALATAEPVLDSMEIEQQ